MFKAQLFILPPLSTSNSLSQFSYYLNWDNIYPVAQAKTSVSFPSLTPSIQSLSRSCWICLQNISQHGPLLPFLLLLWTKPTAFLARMLAMAILNAVAGLTPLTRSASLSAHFSSARTLHPFLMSMSVIPMPNLMLPLWSVPSQLLCLVPAPASAAPTTPQGCSWLALCMYTSLCPEHTSPLAHGSLPELLQTPLNFRLLSELPVIVLELLIPLSGFIFLQTYHYMCHLWVLGSFCLPSWDMNVPGNQVFLFMLLNIAFPVPRTMPNIDRD